MGLTRRRALLFVASLCLSTIGIGAALAQDPRGTIAQIIARDWLALTDRGDGEASWRATGKQFQKAITSDRWEEALKRVRLPYGGLVERTLASTQFARTFPGAPDGDYALLVFRTAFANKTESSETVTLEREADGGWRVIGYSII